MPTPTKSPQYPSAVQRILKDEHGKLLKGFSDFFSTRSVMRRNDLLPAICEGVRKHFSPGATTYCRTLALDSEGKCKSGALAEEILRMADELAYPDPGDYCVTGSVCRLASLVANHVSVAEKGRRGLSQGSLIHQALRLAELRRG